MLAYCIHAKLFCNSAITLLFDFDFITVRMADHNTGGATAQPQIP